MLQSRLQVVQEILSHLCEKGMFGDVAEWCEMRHDCVYVVTCPDCRHSYTLDDEEYEELLRLSETTAPVCGIHPVA